MPLTTLLLAIALGAPQVRDFTIIIDQPNSPIEISAYTATYQRTSQFTREGIEHSLAYRNRGQSKVVAVRFGLVSFDAFNRFLDKMGGIDMAAVDAGKTKKGSWVSSAYSAFAFWTGVAYVQSVRLEDGTIWQADEETVLRELRKVQADFDAKLLIEPRGAGGG